MHAFFCATSFVLGKRRLYAARGARTPIAYSPFPAHTVYFTYPETRGVPLEAMSELFEDAPLEDEEELATERAPLAGRRSRSGSRSQSRSGSPGRPSIEPPDLKGDDASNTDLVGRIFGQEVRPGSSRKNSFEPSSHRNSGTHTPERRAGGYQSVSGVDED